MEILRQQRDGYLELSFDGRLDGYWAQHLTDSVSEVMREGAHSVRLNLSKTSYISSAGIGVLVDIHRRFAAVNGSFGIVEPSNAVKRIIELVGLRDTLLVVKTEVLRAPTKERGTERIEKDGAIFEIQECSAHAGLACRLLGNPDRLAGGFSEQQCRSLAVDTDRLSIGLGAFGDSFGNCRDRFGEFLAISGAAACQPTDGTNFPDYMVSSGEFVPHVSALYALSCEGGFSKTVRFESASGKDPVRLSLILDQCMHAAAGQTAGVVLVAESAGLMGAALKRSPARDNEDSPRLFAYPEIRRWLSFSPERCYPHALALIAGVASMNPSKELRPFLRPIAKSSHLFGHFHAAVFGYRPLPKGRTDLNASVRGLFDAGGLEGVLHILADDREIAGGGESELLRGACWVGPINQLHGEESQ